MKLEELCAVLETCSAESNRLNEDKLLTWKAFENAVERGDGATADAMRPYMHTVIDCMLDNWASAITANKLLQMHPDNPAKR